jgi:hemerythrin-like domain-containing protein
MQDIEGQVARMLHEEHIAVLDLLGRLTGLLNRHGPGTPPDNSEPATGKLLGDLAAAIETEIKAHFDFEEVALFPVLDENGESELTGLYIGDHRTIVPLGKTAAKMVRAASAEGFDKTAWAAFHPVATEFAEQLMRHAEAEEAALIPLLDELLETDEDDRLAQRYEAMR